MEVNLNLQILDPDTLCIEPDNIIERLITKKTKAAIIPVHFGGMACDMKEILEISQKI